MENKGLISVADCPCDGCQAKPCGHPAKCVKFAIWLNKTVDAVEVVRCKNCKHWITDESSSIPDLGNCDIEEDDFTLWRWDCDFCSYGERK